MLDEIEKALRVLAEEEQVIEIRALGKRSKEVFAGYFKHHDVLAMRAEDLDKTGKCKGIYIVLNPLNPELYSRSPEAISRASQTATDSDIIRRRWLPIDLDPVRKTGVSSSHEEHDFALERASEIRDFLMEMGWPEPIKADSGNGAHLLWRIDLPNDTESRKLVEQCLRSISYIFSDDKIKIDTNVGNAARIWKLYGTYARKGENLQERPWRIAKLLDVPNNISIVTADQLRAISSLWKDRSKNKHIDLEKFLVDHNISVHRSKEGLSGKIYVLDICPMNPEHTDRSACIIEKNNGTILFKCHHDHCRDYTWSDVLKKFGEGVVVGGGQTLTIYDVTTSNPNDPDSIKFSPTKAAHAIIGIYKIVTSEDGTMWVYDNGIYVPYVQDLVDKTLNRVAGDLYSIHMSHETIRKIQTETRISGLKWNPNPDLLGLENGVLDLRSGSLIEYSPDMYLTTRFPVTYDPNARCPNIYRFMKTSFESDDDILTCLDLFVSLCRAKASGYFLTLVGPGGNGKKVLESIMMRFVGRDNYTTVRINQLENDRFARQEIMGKRLLINSEVTGEKTESRWIKMIATGDAIDSDIKFKNGHVRFEPYCLQVFDTNLGQRFHDNSRGFTRRIAKIDMPYIFVDNPDPNDPRQRKIDRDLEKKVTSPEELSGLLNIIIKRAPEVISSGHIHLKKSGERMAEEYDIQSHSLSEFIDRFMTYDVHAGFIRTEEIWDDYNRFCECINITPKKISILSRYLKTHFGLQKSRNGLSNKKYGKGYDGLIVMRDDLDKFIQEYTEVSSSVTSDASNIIANQLSYEILKYSELSEEDVKSEGR